MKRDDEARPEFWITAGSHLLEHDDNGALVATPEFIRAYFSRPELAPVEESCPAERALYESLMDDPMQEVKPMAIDVIADGDAQHNYRIMLAFRDLLMAKGSLEAAYLAIVRGEAGFMIPPLFTSQLVHAIMRNIMDGERDPLRLRAAELFFRDQNVSTEDGRVMLADDEIVEMFADTDGLGSIGQLLKESNTPIKQVELDVLHEDNKHIYWQRSDRFDTVIDFRFTQPALDGFARVCESWIAHFLDVEVRVQPMQRIDDEKWRWHIGLDAEATRILNTLYQGETLSHDVLEQIVGLFRLTFSNPDIVRADVRNHPVYLGVAKTPGGKLKLKPQNLLVNLPLAGEM
jgi:hypothetical protein